MYRSDTRLAAARYPVGAARDWKGEQNGRSNHYYSFGIVNREIANGDAAGRPISSRHRRRLWLVGGTHRNMLYRNMCRNMLGIPPMFCYYTCAIECGQEVMATFLRRPCLFLTLWMAGSQRPAIARTAVSDPCVKYTGRPRNRTYRGTASRRGGVSVRTEVRGSHGKAETRPLTLGSAGLAARATRKADRLPHV